jgi:hypothetical protein
MMMYLLVGGIALASGFLARNTGLRFWGGFFLELFLTAVLFVFLGPFAVFPGLLVVLFLQRSERKRRRESDYACPFSRPVRDECVRYCEEQAREEGPDGRKVVICPLGASELKKKPFLKRNADTLAILLCAGLVGLLVGLYGGGGEKKKRMPALRARRTSPSAAARLTAATSPSSPTSPTT